MTVIDERGRLFGRFNLIDAGVVIVLLVLVPLAYAAYRLFRPEPIRIVSVEPARVTVGHPQRIKLHGEHLRPYLRAQVGGEQAHTLLIESPNDGEFAMPDLPVGTFDVSLYDEVQQVAQLKRAITVAPPAAGPRVTIQLIGAFIGLDDAGARGLVKGRKFPDEPGASIEIVDAGAPRGDVRRIRPVVGSEAILPVPVAGSLQVPATLRAVCLPGGENANCAVNGAILSPGVTVPLPGGSSFVIDAIRADVPVVQAVVRIEFVGRPEVIALIAVGDVDASRGEGGARITAVTNRQVRTGQLSRQLGSAGIVESQTVPERFASAEAEVMIAADQAATGFAYRSLPIKPGGLFTFETARYVAHGAIVSVTAAPARGAAK
jgi:hypothetical protein